jgi:ATP-dependent Clp protease adaptor protein ClpS
MAPVETPVVEPDIQEQTQTRLLPPYHVILQNDDYHTFEFVIGVLRKVFGCTLWHAIQLTHEAHTTGRAVVWTGPKEVAELKVEQMKTFHETRSWDKVELGPLTCYIEPAPGN